MGWAGLGGGGKGWGGAGHRRRLGLLGSDPRVQVSKTCFKGRAVFLWLLLYLLKEGKQASAPSCPRMAAQIPGDTPCPLHAPIQSV